MASGPRIGPRLAAGDILPTPLSQWALTGPITFGMDRK
jgi:hypothetical protein